MLRTLWPSVPTGANDVAVAVENDRKILTFSACGEGVGSTGAGRHPFEVFRSWAARPARPALRRIADRHSGLPQIVRGV